MRLKSFFVLIMCGFTGLQMCVSSSSCSCNVKQEEGKCSASIHCDDHVFKCPYPFKFIHFIHAPITRIATSPECGCGYDVLALFTPFLWVSFNAASCDVDVDADLYIHIWCRYVFLFSFFACAHGWLAYADTDYTLHTYRLIFVVYMHIDIENTLPYLFQVPIALERSDEKHNCKQIRCKYSMRDKKKLAKSEQGHIHRCIFHNGVGYSVESFTIRKSFLLCETFCIDLMVVGWPIV